MYQYTYFNSNGFFREGWLVQCTTCIKNVIFLQLSVIITYNSDIYWKIKGTGTWCIRWVYFMTNIIFYNWSYKCNCTLCQIMSQSTELALERNSYILRHKHQLRDWTYIRRVNLVTVFIVQLYQNGVDLLRAQDPLLVWEDHKAQVTGGHHIQHGTGLHQGILLQVLAWLRKNEFWGLFL